MHEYEFRLVVESSHSFLPLLRTLPFPIYTEIVYYLKPHFRYRKGTFETKRIASTHAVYHDSLWFRWVHSIETPYRLWTKATCLTFLHNLGNFQDPFTVESRHGIQLDPRAKLYTFQHAAQSYRLVFEWEYGTFRTPQDDFDPNDLFQALKQHSSIYNLLKPFRCPLFKLNEELTRKPVLSIESVPEGEDFVYAPKWDGTFGLVYSYRDKIKEKWEGYDCVVRLNVTLGEGVVFAAERLEGGSVCLLDVYHVRGHDTHKWCRKEILTHFLPNLTVLEGYFVQTYVGEKDSLEVEVPYKTDGIIIHDVVQDMIFKYKTELSIDLIYNNHYFYLPHGRIKCQEKGLEEGCVYEIATETGKIVRKRTDRFKGNTADQLERILKQGWGGPPIEPLPQSNKKGKKMKTA